MKKYMIASIMLLMICTGCGNKITGTWRCVTQQGMCDLKYDSDGKFYLVDNGVETLRGSWELTESNDTTYLTTDLRVSGLPNEPVMTEKISFEGESLLITGQDGKTNKFIRVK